jgi:hypothetical protein
MLGELAAITYTITSKGQIAIDGKADVKAALGRSPDLAEALMLALGDSSDAGVDHKFQSQAERTLSGSVARQRRGFDHVAIGFDYMYGDGRAMAAHEDRQTLRQAQDPRSRWRGF